MIVQVSPEDIYTIWADVEKLIEKALDDCYKPQDILSGLMENKFQLFISWNDFKVESAIITEMAQYPRKKILRYFLAGGKNLDNWLEPIQKKIEQFAKKKQSNAIEVAGRKGWARKLKGYEQKIYLFTKEL